MPDTTRRQRLGDELRRLRRLAGVSQLALAESAEAINDQVTVSRIESGQRVPSVRQVQAWLALTDQATGARALALLDAAVRTTRSWDEVRTGRASLQRDADGDIQASRLCRSFQVSVIPGLLQVPEMARAVFATIGVADPGKRAAERVARQDVLYEAGRMFRFLVTERVLDCAVAPHVREAQLRHVAAMAESLDVVELGIIPERFNVGVHSFDLFTPDDGDGVFARVELIDEYHAATEPEKIADYEQVWSELWSSATVEDEAVQLIRERMEWST